MYIPVFIILGVIMWMFMAAVKIWVARNHNKRYKYQYPLDPKLLEQIQKGGSKTTAAEAMEMLKKKREAESDAKIKATLGKDLFQEYEERRQGKGKRKKREFDPDMFHDPVSRMYDDSLKKTAEENKAKLAKENDKDKLDAAAVIVDEIRKELDAGGGGDTKRCRVGKEN